MRTFDVDYIEMSIGVDMSHLAKLMRALGRSASKERMFSATAEHLPGLMMANRASVSHPVSSTTMQALTAIDEPSAGCAVEEVAIATSLLGRAFHLRQMLVVDQIVDEDHNDLGPLAQRGVRSAMATPIMLDGQCFGALGVASVHPEFFTAQRQQVVCGIADMVASTCKLIQTAERQRSKFSIDELTGCMERSAVLDHLDAQFADESARPSVIYLDLNDFKLINDLHGHDVGDDALIIFARRVLAAVGPDDVVGRLGGDEFLVVVHDDESGARAAGVAAKIEESGAQPMVSGSLRVPLSTSIGVASPHGEFAETAAEILSLADQAMYVSKRSGRGISIGDADLRRHASMVAAIDRDLDEAMASRTLSYSYQPICWLDNMAVAGVEALVRWDHHEFGPVPTELLIDRVEATGRVAPFTRWSVDTAARDLSALRANAPSFAQGKMGINLSARQLALPECVDVFVAACRKHSLEPSALLVEVVESSEIAEGGPSESTLALLADSGVTIVLDDFGTGHNALRYFSRLPIHGIKFDGSLMNEIETSTRAVNILKSMATMAQDMNLTSVAEGIESQRQVEICRSLGLLFGQGWFLGKPMPFEDLMRLLERTPERATTGSLES